MAKTKVVTQRQSDDGRVWDFRCPYPTGCGSGGEPFTSAGWGDRKHAVERGKQHIAEHEDGKPMPSLHDFRVEHGLTPETAGQPVSSSDWEF